MPHRRKPIKGSFGGHFDELVKHFPDEQASRDEEKQRSHDRSVDDRLFERAWRVDKRPGGC